MSKVNKILTPKSGSEKNTKQKISKNGLIVGFIATIIIIFVLAKYLKPETSKKEDSPVGQQKENILNVNDPDKIIDVQTVIEVAKIDSEVLFRLANVTLDGFYKDKEAWCKAAHDNANTRKHLYYFYADTVDKVNAKYADFGITFEADAAIVNTLKDECEEYGFEL